MIYGHFNHDIGLLPSPEQILFGLILAQVSYFTHLEKKDTDYRFMLNKSSPTWKIWDEIFKMMKSVDFDKPLTHEILSDPSHVLVKTIVYIYSMESFVYKEMNWATRTKDTEKISHYGPLASALSYVINCSKDEKPSSPNHQFIVYRGLTISKSELHERYQVGERLKLKGFTSTASDRSSAIVFTKGGNEKPVYDTDGTVIKKVPLLIKIHFKGTR